MIKLSLSWPITLTRPAPAVSVHSAELGASTVFTLRVGDAWAGMAWVDGPLLHSLEVAPALRGLGLGRVLFETALEHGARELWVEPDNAPARQLYASALRELGPAQVYTDLDTRVAPTLLVPMGVAGPADLAAMMRRQQLALARVHAPDGELATYRAAMTPPVRARA